MNTFKFILPLLLVLITYVSSTKVSDVNIKKVQNIFSKWLNGQKIKPIGISNANIGKLFPKHKDKLDGILKQLAFVNTNEQKVAILNDYTDECLVHLNNLLKENEVDPLALEDLVTGFEFHFWFITYWAEMSLRNGKLQGVATMQRTNDVTVTYEYPNIKVQAFLGFGNLEFDYDYLVQFMGIGPVGTVDGGVDGCKFTFELIINCTDLRANVEKFELNRLGRVSLEFNGYIWFDWFVNMCIDIALIGVKPILRNILEDFVVNLLANISSSYNSIVCQILGDCPGQVTSIWSNLIS